LNTVPGGGKVKFTVAPPTTVMVNCVPVCDQVKLPLPDALPEKLPVPFELKTICSGETVPVPVELTQFQVPTIVSLVGVLPPLLLPPPPQPITRKRLIRANKKNFLTCINSLLSFYKNGV
jgi:hypothetical protein